MLAAVGGVGGREATGMSPVPKLKTAAGGLGESKDDSQIGVMGQVARDRETAA